MEFRDLKRQYKALRSDMDRAISDVLASGTYIGGDGVRELEERLAAYVGRKRAVSCGNGTDALSLLLMALGIGPGDAVFVPSFTFFASAEVVSFEGASPIFVDVERGSFNMDPAKCAEAIRLCRAKSRLRPKAILAVDLFGLPAPFDALQDLADREGLLLLEDGAQGFGGRLGGRMACSFGHAATTSFFPAKPLGCYGDGGMIFTDDEDLAQLLASLKVHGKGGDRYDNVRIGVNSRLDAIQAAVLLTKFKVFETEVEAVQRVASDYERELGDCVCTPQIPEGCRSSWAQYTLILESPEQRAKVREHLTAAGIPSMVYYPKPLHRQTAYANSLDLGQDLRVSEALAETVLSLPMHPYLTREEVQTIARQVREAVL